MPVIKSAKKKLRVDKKRESANKKTEASVNIAIKKVQRQPTQKNIQEAFRLIDKGAKNEIYHKNKASRIKSKLSKLLNKKSQPSAKSEISKVKKQPKKSKK
jgi:small subunit ribosomal protein S20